MKVLIVSFDKTLTEELKKALSEHEVYTAKNSEEAIKVIPPSIEGVIYDAISGAISEEDINTLYTKKFSQARYVILYDELFPVDENNLLPEKKILVPRESPPQEIVAKLIEFPQKDVQEPQDEQVEDIEKLTQELGVEDLEIEHTSLTTSEEEEEPATEPMDMEVEAGQPPEEIEVVPNKILMVSFDQTLIDSMKAYLGSTYEIIPAKTVKQAFEKGKDASVVVFDAISGMVAERGLIELSQDKVMSSKPYIILVDELFPINTNKIPLQDKTVLSRDSNPEEIAEIVKEKAGKATEEVVQEHVDAQVETTSEEELREEVPELEASENIETITEEVDYTQTQEPPQQEESIPALEALEKVIEEKGFEEEPPHQEPEEEPVQKEVEPVELVAEEPPKKEEPSQVVTAAVSEEAIKEAVRKAIEESMSDIKELVADMVRQEVEKVFEDIDVKGIIKQVTYQALRERLEELIS